jgi:hypothetical protein
MQALRGTIFYFMQEAADSGLGDRGNGMNLQTRQICAI